MNINVYDEIAANDRKTIIILLAFPVAFFITVFLFSYLYAFVSGSFDLILSRSYRANTELLSQFRAQGAGVFIFNQALQLTLKVYPWIFIIICIWLTFSYYKGGSMMLNVAKARPVTIEENRELFHLVENTAIMIGLPTPQIYLIEDESLNAFATGRTPDTSSIALTDGIVKKLDKAELQAVIAHELAHINNRDTRLMLITIAGIGCFIFLGEFLFRAASHGNRGKGAFLSLILGAACLVFGYIVAPILRFALSRRREYQADATAAQITRDPEALVRALYKISVNPRVESLDSIRLIANICIANPAKAGLLTGLYLTHPPIEDRIAGLTRMTIAGKRHF